MKVKFADDDLARVECEKNYTAGLGADVVKGFRKAMGAIRAATDSRDLYFGGLQTEKLKGPRQHQHSVRINKQWRLIIQIKDETVDVQGIEDYH